MAKRLGVLAWAVAAWVWMTATAGAADLRAHWPLNEGTGTTISDASGRGNGGVLYGGGTWVARNGSYVLALDGTDDYVAMGNPSDLNITQTLSITAWVKPDLIPSGEKGICGKAFESYMLTYYSDRQAWGYIGSSGTSAKGVLRPRAFSHVALTYDGAKIRLYVNGQLRMETNRTGSIPSGANFYIGRGGSLQSQGYFRGQLGDVKVYSGALTATEIQNEYTAGLGGRFAPTTADGLMAHWPLNEGSGQTAYDVTGGGSNGTITGGAWTTYRGGNVLLFDGEDDCVTAPGSGMTLLDGPCAISAWVNPDELPRSEPGIAGKQFNSQLLSYYSCGSAYWYIAGGGNNVNGNISVGVWNHVVGTYDGTTMRLFINGVKVAEKPSLTSNVSDGSPFYIGRHLSSTTFEEFFRGLIADVKVYARDVSEAEVLAEYNTGIAGRYQPETHPCNPIASGVDISGDGLSARIASTGAIQINANGSYCLLESTFSWPRSPIGTNAFSQTTYLPEATWQPSVTALGASAARITAQGASYRVERTVRIQNGRFEIEDAVTNLTGARIGILMKHFVTTPSAQTPKRLGFGPEDPILFFGQSQYAFGLLALDVVSRSQFASFSDANRSGFRLNHYGLAPSASYTSTFAAYVMPASAGAMDYVNIVRNAFGSNHTLKGPCEYMDMFCSPLTGTVDSLRDYLAKKTIKVVLLSPWLDYDPGSRDYVLPRSEYKTRAMDAAAKLRAADPAIKVLGCIETDWVDFNPDTLENPRPCLQFDGVDDDINCGSGSAVNLTGAVSVAAWIKPSNLPSGEAGVAGKDFSRYLLTYYTDGKCWWYIGNGGNNLNASVATNAWSHVVGTFDGTTMKLYINGSEAGSRTSQYSSYSTGGTLHIGRGGGGYTFPGRINDVRIYNRALSAAEVATQYAAMTGRYNPSSDSGLVARYKLNEGTGATATDSSGNNNNGSISGASWVTETFHFGQLIADWGEGGYGYYVMPPEFNDLILESNCPFRDSVKVAAGGGIWMELYVRGANQMYALGVYPAPGNYQTAFLLNQINFLHNECGLDGYYTDEFSLTWVDSYETGGWDNHTVDISLANGAVVRSYVDANLAGVQPRLQIQQYAVTNGLTHVANTYETTTEGQALPSQRFFETWGDVAADLVSGPGTMPPFLSDLTVSQFGTPIGLGAQAPSGTATAEKLMNCVRTYLRHGMVYYYYVFQNIDLSTGEYGPINHMFPITPVRLFEGGIEGQERTITCIDGTFDWNHSAMPNVMVFDKDGRLRTSGYACQVVPNGSNWRVTLDLNDWSDFGVISGDAEMATRVLQVQSTPLTGVAITGTAAGTTNYSAGFGPGASVSLTAPSTAASGQTDYTFSRWVLYRDAGLVGRWKLSEGSGATAADSSGIGNHGVISGAAWTDDGGICLAFDGSDDQVSCGRPHSLDLRNALTLSVWLKPAQTPAGEVGVAGKGYGSFALTYYANGRAYFYIGSGGNALSTDVPLNQWTHLVAVYDGATMKLYKNGVEVGARASSVNPAPSGKEFLIGAGADGLGRFTGRISDVKAYARALSGAEVAAQYALGRGGILSEPQTLGQTTVNFTINEAATAVAQYDVVLRRLRVQSTPVTGVAITGTNGGTTNYAANIADNSQVTLTAPATFADGSTDYVFKRWRLVTNLMADWPLNEGSGATANDQTGYGNTGAISGAAWLNDSARGWVLDFDGSDDGVDCGGGSSLDLTGSMSLVAWVHPDATPGSEVGICGKDLTRYLLTFYTDNRSYFYVGAGGNDARGTLAVGEWNHLVAVFDAASQRLKLYRNGALADDDASTYSSWSTGGVFRIGRRELSSGGVFDGKISGVRVYNRALTADEAAAEHASGTPAGAAQPDGQTSVTFTINQPMTAVAEYEIVRHTLVVRSTPVSGVAITGTKPGTTRYTASVNDNAQVTLTAPSSITSGGKTYDFQQWKLVYDLRADLPLSEGSGSTANDLSACGNTGTVSGAAWLNDAERGYVLDFDGSDDEVDCGTGDSLNLTGPLTVVAWAKPDTLPASGNEPGIAGKSFERYLLTYYGNGRAYWYFGSGGNHCDTAVSTGEWTHLAGVYDGSSIRLYKNGSLADSDSSIYSSIPTGGTFRIGRRDVANGSRFDGKISGVRVYGRALSASEVSDDYATGLAGTAQARGETSVTFTMNSQVTAVAEYAERMEGQRLIIEEPPSSSHVLSVVSTPISAVPVAGNHPGVTDYVTDVTDGESVTLTAPAQKTVGRVIYRFKRWRINGMAQPANRTSVTFTVTADANAVAEYAR